jgi:hypothetical protein
MIQGTLDLLILKTISMGPRHGWAIAKRSLFRKPTVERELEKEL